MTAREINQFIRGHNYFYTDFLMTKTYESNFTLKKIIDYFKYNMDYCIQYLDDVDPEFKQVTFILFSIIYPKRVQN